MACAEKASCFSLAHVLSPLLLGSKLPTCAHTWFASTTLPKGDMEKAPKRLCGWKLAQEMSAPSSSQEIPCQKGVEDSPLVTKLLELWSQGKISASQAAEIAHLAHLEGALSKEIVKVAKCGNFSQCKGNSHRDMMQLFLKDCKLCNPWPVTVEVKDPKTQKLALTEASVMLPHLLFSTLYQNCRDQFEELCS